MTLAHIAALFEYEKLKRDINDLRSDLDREEFTSLRVNAKAILESNPQVWKILERFHQYDLQEERVEAVAPYVCTFVVLSQYLQVCPSIDYPTWQFLTRRVQSSQVRNWKVLQQGLLTIGWTARDVILLIEGMSVPWLVKPDVVADPIERLPSSHAWYSLGRTGWLDRQEIQRLLVRLEQSRGDFLHLNPASLPLHDITSGELVSDEQIELAFVCAWGMLRTADVAGAGLFLAIVS